MRNGLVRHGGALVAGHAHGPIPSNHGAHEDFPVRFLSRPHLPRSTCGICRIPRGRLSECSPPRGGQGPSCPPCASHRFRPSRASTIEKTAWGGREVAPETPDARRRLRAASRSAWLWRRASSAARRGCTDQRPNNAFVDFGVWERGKLHRLGGLVSRPFRTPSLQSSTPPCPTTTMSARSGQSSVRRRYDSFPGAGGTPM